MLQIDKSRPGTESQPSQPALISLEEIFESYVAFVRRQFPVILFVMVLTIGLAAAYLSTEPPRYTGEAILIIDTHKLNFLQQQSPLGVDMPGDTAMVDSQVEVLNSENVALAVIKDLHLIDDPEFVGPDGGLISTVLNLVSGLFASSQPQSEFQLTRRALAVFQSRLNIKRIGLTYVIEIDYQSLSRDRAAQIANAVADAYVVDSLEVKYQATRRAGLWLQDRLKELRTQGSAAEKAAVDFKVKNNIVDTGGRLMNEQQLAEFNSQLVLARAQIGEAQAKLNRVLEIMQTEDRSASTDNTATVADTLHDDVITRLRQQYLELAARESDWSTRYGKNHLAAVNLRNQMHEIRKAISDELHRIAQTYKSDYEVAKSREEAVEKGLNDIVTKSNETNRAQITLHDLASTAQNYRALADNFLQSYMESVQQQSFPITESHLITRAAPPMRPSHPKTLLVLAIAGVGGMVLSVGVGLLRDLSDRVYRTGSQVEADLHSDCIAVVPLVKDAKRALVARGAADRAAPGRDQDLWQHVLNSPFSRFTESIQSIKVAADLYGVSKVNKVIAMTSSLPREGKSTVAVALAQLVSHAGSRVILVDSDLRNPSLSRWFAPMADVGVLEVISGKVALEDAIWADEATNMLFLPAVVRTRVAHISDVLGSMAMMALFKRLREKFDYVIVDLSPLAPVVDVRATAGLIDSYVLVIEWGRTKIDVVQHALGTARSVYDNLLGIVLNKADIKVLSRYENYRGSYYYNRDYARYGYND